MGRGGSGRGRNPAVYVRRRYCEADRPAMLTAAAHHTMKAGHIAVAAAPRVIWVTSLVLMLTFISMCQGGFLFGVSSSEKVLSVHYICMSIAWPIVMTEALLIYRAPLFSTTNTRVIKVVHAVLQTLVGAFITVAMVYAVEYKHGSRGAHFWSVHAWIGAGAIALYCLQYPLGLYVYVLSSMTPSRKAEFYQYHRFLGLATYIAGLVGGISGLMETQEFDMAGLLFVGPQSYRLGTMLLAAKAFLSLLLGLTVTYAWVVLPQVGKPARGSEACHVPSEAFVVLGQVGKAQALEACPEVV
ncbi:hypothetical protein WJX81_005931 [Elliptochloris bilobata]|uniref:Cytochrome b561 domain-containing protein n=1 Tax=Elliptochloris bilobata TaxID=381761 RepID=A0AAW1RFS5_9CHLO